MMKAAEALKVRATGKLYARHRDLAMADQMIELAASELERLAIALRSGERLDFSDHPEWLNPRPLCELLRDREVARSLTRKAKEKCDRHSATVI